MARLSDEDRKAAREARDKFIGRLRQTQSGVFTRVDAEDGQLFRYVVDGVYALTHDDWPCPTCGAPCRLEVNVTRLYTRKTWRCPDCRSTSIGQFSTYVIREWPGL